MDLRNLKRKILILLSNFYKLNSEIIKLKSKAKKALMFLDNLNFDKFNGYFNKHKNKDWKNLFILRINSVNTKHKKYVKTIKKETYLLRLHLNRVKFPHNEKQ